jgi:hypothetical protein
MKIYFIIALVFVLLIGFAVVCFHPSIGFLPESNFSLSPDSRLPKWFSIPPGYSRKDVTVEIYYYVPPPFIRSNFKAILIGPSPENKVLAKKIGIMRDHPNYANERFKYPTYNIAVVDEIKEIIEHRQPEPIFYISDDPRLR